MYFFRSVLACCALLLFSTVVRFTFVCIINRFDLVVFMHYQSVGVAV